MIRLLLDAAMAVYLIVPAYPLPAQYTADTPAGDALAYHPQRGWVSPAECAQGCWVAPGTEVRLLFGEFDLQTLAAPKVRILRNGEPVVWFHDDFFGGRAVYHVKPE